MLQSLKTFLIILVLGLFIIPNQHFSAQNRMEYGSHQTMKENCCDTSCHTDDKNKDTEKEGCADHCKDCTSCSVHFVSNFISLESKQELDCHFFAHVLNADYQISYFSSNIQNIWQPPKLN